MYSDEQLQYRLSEKAVTYWLVEEILTFIVSGIVLGGLLIATYYWHWPSWLASVFIGLMVLVAIASIYSLCTLRRKYMHWSYDYDERFFYMKEGVLTKRLTVIPFEKLQSVTLKEGLLLNQYGLAAIELQGIEKMYGIPALDQQVASMLQMELAELTRKKEGIQHEAIAFTDAI